MTPDEILKGLYDETMVGNKPAVLELTQEGIDSGLQGLQAGSSGEQSQFDRVHPVVGTRRTGHLFEFGTFLVGLESILQLP